MNATVDPDSAINRQARDWALAVFGEPFPPERSRALGQWLEADPRHALAYAEAERLMLALGEFDAAAKVQPRRPPVTPWLWSAGAALAACLVAAVLLVPQPATYVAGMTIRSAALHDGSTVLLAPGSTLRAAAWWTDRRYVLERGEALFDVRHAAGRRFEVVAGPARVTVLGTRFDVRNGQSGEVRVAVQRGSVAVARTAGRADLAATPRLGPGDVLTLGPSTLQRGTLADPAQVGAWTSGQLAYASAPLGDIVADINAYGRVRTTVAAPADRLRLTASFRVDQAEAFVAGLPDLLPVTVETRPDGTQLITARRAPQTRRP